MALASVGAGTLEVDEMAIWHRALPWEEILSLEEFPSITQDDQLSRLPQATADVYREIPEIDTELHSRWTFDEEEGRVTRALTSPRDIGLICGRADRVSGRSGGALQFASDTAVYMPAYAEPVAPDGGALSMTVSFWLESPADETASLTFRRRGMLPQGGFGGYEIVTGNRPADGHVQRSFEIWALGAEGRREVLRATLGDQNGGYANWTLVYDHEAASLAAYCNGLLVTRKGIAENSILLPRPRRGVERWRQQGGCIG
jgi:hypothetical protein